MIKTLLELFFVFFKIGSISFGGGYAMIPFLEHETISRGWLTQEKLLDMIAISQITPGPIATNMATFVGFEQAQFLGALFATIGVTAPSVILVLLVTKIILNKLKDNTKVTIFYGLKPTITALLFITAITIPLDDYFNFSNFENFTKFFKEINYFGIAISICSYFLFIKFKNKNIPILLLCGVVSVIYYQL
ncbi:MAG: chromate transporter [Lachnospirales bacterium]